jgi:NDP-sugar pyrophosphorylase family protein
MRKAVVLAAGRGKRMGELTRDLPKPMIPVNGKPLLEHILDRLSAAGYRQVLLVTGYRAESIERHFAGYPLAVEFIRQNEPNGTARAAILAREFAGSDPFLLTFGDILTESDDYVGLMAGMQAEEVEGVIGVKYVPDPYQGAAVYATHGRVTAIIEKPPQGSSETHWNSAGLYAFRESIFEELAGVPLSPRGEYELTSAVSQMLIKGKTLSLYELRGGWRDVGRPGDLDAAEHLTDS